MAPVFALTCSRRRDCASTDGDARAEIGEYLGCGGADAGRCSRD